MKRFPTKAELIEFITQNPQLGSKREIAKAFGIKGADRVALKDMLKELAQEGHVLKRKRSYARPGKLPPVVLCDVAGVDEDGDLWLRPAQFEGEGEAPKILFRPRHNDPALGVGERALVKITAQEHEDYPYFARLIKRIATQSEDRILGIFEPHPQGGGQIRSVDKRQGRSWLVPQGHEGAAQDGELVFAESTGRSSRGAQLRARVVECLGNPYAANMISLIAVKEHGIPDTFPTGVMENIQSFEAALDTGREDLTHLPLITIDPITARDHDDAVYAHPDEDPQNQGGHVLWVAIADVAHYVTSGSALDNEAKKRGNSCYFPDRVVPMLPEKLSADLCSLHEEALRPCIAVRMVIDAQGEKIEHRFVRGVMKSPAALHYEEVQTAQDGHISERVAPHMQSVIKPLYAAYEALKIARAARQPLDLDLPERQISLSPEGQVSTVQVKDRLDAHMLIEVFMVLANVAAAETLAAADIPLLYRVHEEPAPEKLETLRDIAKAAGYALPKGQRLTTGRLNQLLKAAEGSANDEIINMTTLRAMTQAYYSPQNHGHFGLALEKYAHFTSPIRRYADLLVHRALITAHSWGTDGLSDEDLETLEQTAQWISSTERRAMRAERETTDRYMAAYLSERIGDSFSGRISGIARFGVFVKLDDTGADGIVPLGSLGDEYFHFNHELNLLKGADSGAIISMGMPVTVRLSEATPVTGGIALEILDIEGRDLPKSRKRRRGVAGRKSSKPKVSRRRRRL